MLDDNILNKLVRQFSAGEYLFLQGDTGNTMYLVLEGSLVLYRRSNNVDRWVATVSTGEILGEKALVGKGSYRRTVTARAKSNVTVAEIDQQNFKLLQSRMPDFALKVIRLLSERLDMSNELIGILQSQDEVDRVIQYFHFFGEHHSKKITTGQEISLSITEISNAINVQEPMVEEIVHALEDMKVLIRKNGGYVISEGKSLSDQTEAIRQKIAA